jgi:hypothetical protein
MHIPLKLELAIFNYTNAIPRVLLAILAGMLSATLHSTPALAQSVPLPGVLDIENDPACASSANGTGHIVCVVSQNNQLSAVAVLAVAGGFGVPALDSNNIVAKPPTAGPNNPLSLGVSGTVGNSNCSSTADASGDIVCAYNSGSALMGVRFNIFNNVQPITQSLGMTVLGNASCAIGAARAQLLVGGKPQPPLVSTEGVDGETICAFRSTNNELWGIAFNPAATQQVPQSLDLGVAATGDPSCAGAVDGSDQVICAFMTANGLHGIAFDPRPATTLRPGTPIKSAIQSLYAGTLFQGNPGCAIPNDTPAPAENLGEVICAIRSGTTNTLLGFAFNPRNTTLLPLAAPQLLGATTTTGNPSCAGVFDGTNEVICGFLSSTNIVNSVKFDPRRDVSNMISIGLTSASNLSCTFQNIIAYQISCAGVLPTGGQLSAIILSPLNPGVKALIPTLFLL